MPLAPHLGSKMTEPSVGPLTRGFLFADLRDYTAYAEAHGDRAAADLLDRYRALVRVVVAGSAGAEVRTEGDSFYVVFPSASAAVGAGLALVAAAAEASAAEPANPIRVGVGIHAGEAEERAEGYVGTAVNVAARVCAEAAAGEVLVTDTVRSLTRTGGRYRFTSRGSHRLKGLAEPIALYRAEAVTEGAARRAEPRATGVRRGAAALAIVALGAITLGAAYVALGGPGSGPSRGPSPSSAGASASPLTSASAGASPSGVEPFPNGIIEPGTYETADFKPRIRLTFADDAWGKALEVPSVLILQEVDNVFWTEVSARVLVLFRPGVGYVGCSNDETKMIGANAAEDVIEYLTGNPGLDAEAPAARSIARLDGVLVRFRLGPACGTDPGAKPLFQLWMGTGALSADHILRALTGPVYEVFVTEVNGDVLALWFAAPEVRWDAFSESARSLLTTLEIVD